MPCESLGPIPWLRLRGLELREQGLVRAIEAVQLDRFARRLSPLFDEAKAAIGEGEVPVHVRIVGAKSRRFDICDASELPILTLERDVADFHRINALARPESRRLLGGGQRIAVAPADVCVHRLEHARIGEVW